jgi:hypothetical protein
VVPGSKIMTPQQHEQEQRRRNLRLGLILALVVLVLFFGFIAQRYLVTGAA